MTFNIYFVDSDGQEKVMNAEPFTSAFDCAATLALLSSAGLPEQFETLVARDSDGIYALQRPRENKATRILPQAHRFSLTASNRASIS